MTKIFVETLKNQKSGGTAGLLGTNPKGMFIKGVKLAGLPKNGVITCEKQDARHGSEFMLTYFDEENREFSEAFFLGYTDCVPEKIDAALHEAAARIRAQIKGKNVAKNGGKNPVNPYRY